MPWLQSEQALTSFGSDRMTPAFEQAGISEQIKARPAAAVYAAFDLVH